MQNNLLNELSTNFIEYSVAVNTDRAIPDAKSGLKPVAKSRFSVFKKRLKRLPPLNFHKNPPLCLIKAIQRGGVLFF